MPITENSEYTVPEFGKVKKQDFTGDDALELFQAWNDRNGRFVQEQLIRLVWTANKLPLYRGIPRMLPFELKLDKVLWNLTDFTVTVQYHFSDRRA